MHPARVVALYGRSLILEGVGRRIEQKSGLRVVMLERPTPAALALLDPDVLMVDLGAIDIPSALALTEDRPQMLLVGLEASGARLLILSAPQARAMTTDDLVGFIERPAGLVADRD